ncbi:MAG TPA: nucleotidyltransferase domain-containing protein [Candidatus Melainabacteria bacterium]|nr:nucleotidyltransferase domain-containing protein [Candidatus Melainabacteria bacterium]
MEKIEAKLNVPSPVEQSLQELVESLKRGAGDNLQSVIIYGSIARGHFRPGASDVNLVILLKDVSASELDKIDSPLRKARNSINVNAMIMTGSEVARSADVFPVKFMHIKNYHLVLFGDDPFADLSISPKHLRIRLEQELRNISIRLRNRYVNLHQDRSVSIGLVTNLMGSFAVQLRTLLELTGKPLPQEHSTKAHLMAAAEAFDLDKEALEAASELRRDVAPALEVQEIFARVMKSVDKAVDVADQLEIKE